MADTQSDRQSPDGPSEWQLIYSRKWNKNTLILQILFQYLEDERGVEEISTILRRNTTLINVGREMDGKTPLLVAIHTNQLETCKWLLDAGTNINQVSVNSKDCTEESPLHCAIRAHVSVDIFKLLVDRGADINARMPCGYTAIHAIGIRYGYEPSENHMESQYDKLVILLDHGCDVQTRTFEGDTCLHLFCPHNDTTEEILVAVKMLKLLIDHGIDVDAIDMYGQTALHVACQDGFLDFVEVYLEKGADVNMTDYTNGQLPLHLLLRSHSITMDEKSSQLVKLFIQKGTNINARTFTGETPLHILCQLSTYAATVHTFLELGADIHMTYLQGRTVLHSGILAQSKLNKYESKGMQNTDCFLQIVQVMEEVDYLKICKMQ